jgi:hypothetical protein
MVALHCRFAASLSKQSRAALAVAVLLFFGASELSRQQQGQRWIDRPQNEWPQITMINQIEYVGKKFPIAGCSFLLDTGKDTLVATAKHILTYFKSDTMKSVFFANSLKEWRMFPKNNPADVVVADSLLNADSTEALPRIPSQRDWLLFSIKQKSKNIKPLKFRTDPLQPGEPVFIVGWRYTDTSCTQRIYEGNYVESSEGSVIISTKLLSDNRMPGLSGSPVIDSHGCVIGIMSQKHGKLERLGSVDYPRRIIESRR